jgi:uncharacterized membrane protein
VDRGRLEAFSDGVFAIVITIMVLELHRPPDGKTGFGDLWDAVGPSLVAYVLSFVYVGIYWNNHHHLLKQVRKVTASVMWANLGLLFFLTLLPFVTAWGGEHHDVEVPVFVYGVVLLCAAGAYFTLQTVIVLQNGGWDGPLGTALGKDYKGRASLALYSLALVLVWLSTWLAFGLYVAVAVMWFIPDRRLERAMAALEGPE